MLAKYGSLDCGVGVEIEELGLRRLKDNQEGSNFERIMTLVTQLPKGLSIFLEFLEVNY